jgi:hypothetical protein
MNNLQRFFFSEEGIKGDDAEGGFKYDIVDIL